MMYSKTDAEMSEMPDPVQPQAETQKWRRMRKALASLLGDVSRYNVRTWEDVKTRIEEIAVFAAEQEHVWVMRIPKEGAPAPCTASPACKVCSMREGNARGGAVRGWKS